MFSIHRHMRAMRYFGWFAVMCGCLLGTARPALAQVCATRVGYYDALQGQGVPSQALPIQRAGFVPVQIFTLSAAELAGINVLFVQNPDNLGIGGDYTANLGNIQAAVNAGMVLVLHDRWVRGASGILPGAGTVQFVRSSFTGDNMRIDILDGTTLVTNGPGGVVTDTNLDRFDSSNHGYAVAGSLPPGNRKILSNGNPEQVVEFSYPFGNGYVVYSSIPLDFYLGSVNVFADIYAPNVVAYGGSLRPAMTTLTVSPATGTYGGVVNFSVTASSAGIGLGGLRVDFFRLGVFVGSAATANGSGRASLLNVPLGSLAALVYPGGVSASFSTARFCGSGSATLAINRAAPRITVSGGGTFTFDGRPHAASGLVSGVFGESLGLPDITYTDLSTNVTSSEAPVNAGSYGVNASFVETQNYSGGSNNSVRITIVQATTSTVLTSTPNPSLYGQGVTLNVTVSPNAPGGGTPTGQVFVKDGTFPIGNFPVGGFMTTTGLSLTMAGSPHSLTAEFVSDTGNFSGSTSAPVLHDVTQASTTIDLASSPNPSYFGQQVSFTATVHVVAPGGETPTGQVQLFYGATPGPLASLVNGVATLDILNIDFLPVGTQHITAEYLGSANHGASTSSEVLQEVTKANTATSVASSTNPSVYGQMVTYTATVNRDPSFPGPPASTLNGTVTFMDGGTPIGMGPLAGGVAMLTTDALLGGDHSITVVYGGNPDFMGSTSNLLMQTVNTARATIQVDGFSGVYDGQPHGATGAAAGVHGENLSSLLNLGDSFTNVPGGTATWTFAGNGNYASATGSVVIAIAPRGVTVTADAKTKVFGALDPSLTYQMTAGSLVGGDGFSGSLTRATGEGVGTHPITQGTLALSGNYSLNYVGADLTITPPPFARYSVHLFYDPTKTNKSGSTVPIKIQLWNTAGNNVSSASLVVHATAVHQISALTSGLPEAPGDANPDNDFRVVGPAVSYMFNLKTTGLAAGTYELLFVVGDDPVPYSILFQVR